MSCFLNTYPSTPIYQVLGEKGISCCIVNGYLLHIRTRAHTYVCNEVEINHRVGDTTSSLSYRMSTKQLASVTST